MKRLTRFQVAKRDIVDFFEEYNKDIFSYSEISLILNQNRKFWRLPESQSTFKFIDQLTTFTKLKRYEFDFPWKKYTKFTWGDVSIYKLCLNLHQNSYFTHYTALYWHNLTDQIPKTIYVNFEQSQKRSGYNKLIQENINRAFKNPQRITTNVAEIGDYKICLLNGKYTNNQGVTEIETRENEKIILTDIERTLIDIVVRPSYSGGIHEVLNAYRKAVGKVSINKLSAMLKKLKYIYPYHQAIGFYLQRAGVYRDTQINILKKFEFEYDFSLTHQMKETEYSAEWKLYYPKGF